MTCVPRLRPHSTAFQKETSLEIVTADRLVCLHLVSIVTATYNPARFKSAFISAVGPLDLWAPYISPLPHSFQASKQILTTFWRSLFQQDSDSFVQVSAFERAPSLQIYQRFKGPSPPSHSFIHPYRTTPSVARLACHRLGRE